MIEGAPELLDSIRRRVSSSCGKSAVEECIELKARVKRRSLKGGRKIGS